jgi:hypothetical protein
VRSLRYTLLTDGSSDRALLPILSWLLEQQEVGAAMTPAWADDRVLRKPPKSLPDRIHFAITAYECDLLFVHRDAERMSRAERIREIRHAVAEVALTRSSPHPPVVCVVPVRMTETWLLCDEAALRRAADNPLGDQPLSMPALRTLERRADPKRLLHSLLLQARGRRRSHGRQFDINEAVQRLASLIDDFSPLRALSAFAALEEDLATMVREQGWNGE